MASSPVDSKTPANGIQCEAGILSSSDANALQKHVAFFDQNKDGLVYPWETFEGKFPSLLFPIEIKNIQKAKHGSDTDVYDTDGRFVPSKFEDIFSKYARTRSFALTADEVMEMVKSNRESKDYAGWLASYTEWMILYVLCKDKNGLLHRDTIKAVYDGSLFDRMAKEKASNSGK